MAHVQVRAESSCECWRCSKAARTREPKPHFGQCGVSVAYRHPAPYMHDPTRATAGTTFTFEWADGKVSIAPTFGSSSSTITNTAVTYPVPISTPFIWEPVL